MFTDVPHKLIKFGGTLRLQKTRYFLIDQENILYFTKETDTVAKGYKSLRGSKAVLQTKEEAQQARAAKWVEAAKAFRVVISLKGRESNPIYVYSGDAHYCKALLVKIRTVSDPLFLQNLTVHGQQISRIYRAC